LVEFTFCTEQLLLFKGYNFIFGSKVKDQRIPAQQQALSVARDFSDLEQSKIPDIAQILDKKIRTAATRVYKFYSIGSWYFSPPSA
jgi:hypothetical protein